MKYFVIPSNFSKGSLKALICLVQRTSFFLILYCSQLVCKPGEEGGVRGGGGGGTKKIIRGAPP